MYSGMSSSTSSQQGAQVCMEGTQWRIKNIGYDGVERYVERPTFKGLIEKNARNINWRDIVGKDASIDFTRGDNTIDEKEKRLLNQISKIEPAAGPWAAVAKSIHASWNEMNVLLDTLHLTKTQYLSPVMVTMIIDDQKVQDQIISSKAFQFYVHKKTVSESAAGVIQAGEKSHYGESSDKSSFFNELRKMRENWRIRKMNNSLFGDLGYRIYHGKYRASEVFDVVRNSLKEEHVFDLERMRACSATPSMIGFEHLCPVQVKVPNFLARRSTLCVSVRRDSEGPALDYYETNNIPVNDYTSRNAHWEKALKWAQNTLICGDIFSQLLKDCVGKKIFCMTTENTIVLNLFDDIILKIDLRHHLFQEIEIVEEGDTYLNRSLRELFVAGQMKKPFRNQQFISLPPTRLPENLDLRGPLALSTEEIAARMPKTSSLLNQFIEVSNHYILVDMVLEAIEQHTIVYSDPLLHFKFARSTNVHSILSLSFKNRFYEQLGRFSLYVRIFSDKVVVITKESQYIHCGRQMGALQDALLLLTANYQLQIIALLSKHYAWQILHSNNNAFNKDGIAAPTLYICNHTASTQIFIQFLSDGSKPLIHVKPIEDPDEPLSAKGTSPTEKFRLTNYNRLPGTTLLRKMDYLLLTFRI